MRAFKEHMEKQMQFKVEIEKVREDSVNLLKDVLEVFEKNRIKCWLDQGTALGALREKDFIPWDDDIDIGTWKSAVEAKPEIWHDLRKKGYNVFNYGKVTAVKVEKRDRNFGWRSVDIHLYQLAGEKAFKLFNGPKRPGLLNFLFAGIHFIDAISEVKHGPDIGIKNIKEQLKKLGNNCGELEASTYYSRSSNIKKSFTKILAKITPDILLFYIKHFLSRIRLKFCAELIYSEAPASFFQKLEKIYFLGLHVGVPSPIENYLIYKFGPNWKTPRSDWVFYKEDGSITT